MKILLVNNRYGKFSGEEAVVEGQAELLKANGHDVLRFERDSADIRSVTDKISAFFSGIHSAKSRRQLNRMIAAFNPDVVHIHNLFPLISPGILPDCGKAGVPVVMTVHNYRLVCPNGLHLTHGQVCTRCCGGREWACFFQNCERDLFKSLGYALRNAWARKRRCFLDNVTAYAVLCRFQRDRLVAEGFPAERVTVIPNMVDTALGAPYEVGSYVGFVGRVSPEKGIKCLIDAGLRCPDVAFKVVGDYTRMAKEVESAPPNLEFLGHYNLERLSRFYGAMRLLVFPSIWFETFGLALVEAMLHGKPVIASRIGGIPEIVDDGETGLLFEPGNAEELAEKIEYLWERPELCRKMGAAGREKALREYSPGMYYNRLISLYEKVAGGCVGHRRFFAP